MPLTNVQIRPGFNKADTPSGAEGQWIVEFEAKDGYKGWDHGPELAAAVAAAEQKLFSKQHSASAWHERQDENYLSFTSPIIQYSGERLENQRLQGKPGFKPDFGQRIRLQEQAERAKEGRPAAKEDLSFLSQIKSVLF